MSEHLRIDQLEYLQDWEMVVPFWSAVKHVYMWQTRQEVEVVVSDIGRRADPVHLGREADVSPELLGVDPFGQRQSKIDRRLRALRSYLEAHGEATTKELVPLLGFNSSLTCNEFLKVHVDFLEFRVKGSNTRVWRLKGGV